LPQPPAQGFSFHFAASAFFFFSLHSKQNEKLLPGGDQTKLLQKVP
jgi:hypothetical protein